MMNVIIDVLLLFVILLCCFFVFKRFNARLKSELLNANAKVTALTIELQNATQHAFNSKQAMIENELANYKEKYEQLSALYQKHYIERKEELLYLLQNYCALTKNEAQNYLLKYLEDELKRDKANLIRRYEAEARAEAKIRANFLIAEATVRMAGTFAKDNFVSDISIENNKIIGQIIGKDGKNMKTMNQIMGVDVIIDKDNPNTIQISSFNLYRRAIAKRTIEMLIDDGRINPARIEEFYEKVQIQMEDEIFEIGQNVILDLRLDDMHPELIKLVGKLKYRTSYGQNALMHSIEVAKLSGYLATELGADVKLAKRAGLLHDIGKALTYDTDESHVELGLKVCKQYNEHPVVINAILAHHGNEDSKSIECCCACAADALSAARPGARSETLESIIKRAQDLENIAGNRHGIQKVYAMQAGREVRVFVKPQILSDDDIRILSQDIAKDIKQSMQYPGKIAVNVIRETRSKVYV